MEICRQYDGMIRKEPFTGKLIGCYDVIIAGLGTAGAIAAIAAARKGLKVLAIERLHGMGGTGTVGAVWTYYFGSKGGLYEQLDAQAQTLQRGCFTPAVGVNGEAKLAVMEQEAAKAGVDIRYGSTVIGALIRGNKLCGIEWISAEGRFVAESKIVIDCTSEAEVSGLAGGRFKRGREFEGQAQPYSNVWVYIDNGRVRYGHVDSGYVNQGDPQDLSRAILESATAPTHLRDVYEEESRLLRTSPMLGIREGRFIEGEENVTFADYIKGKHTAQPLFFAYANLDNHSKDVAFESELQQQWIVVSGMLGYNFKVPIPLGALIPKGIEGLLVAGRCMAVDHDIAACVRMKRDMQKSGEAAAAIAYLSIKEQVPLKQVSYTKLLDLLEETGCLTRSEHVQMKEAYSQDDATHLVVQWLTDPDEIRQGLASAKPGLAIWSATVLGDSMRPQLKQWMEEEPEEHLGRHSVFALAMTGDEAAAPLLRRMVREHDSFVPHRSNYARGYAAIFLLGMLANRAAVEELYGILELPSETKQAEVYFQYISFSVMALARIGERHSDLRLEIAEAYRKLLERKDLDLTIMLSDRGEPPYSMNHVIVRAIEQTKFLKILKKHR
ncbi:FAD-dependent oxidoreductase [Paenibacillus sp. GXUN7292]|uniref:FAD-dependent oxidoreductase n=1 Tax=Paenibacillus sp. GXUN7292 TaxID=3422499 RepID=UPI003D7EFC00